MSIELELRNGGPRLDFSTSLPVGKITALLGPSGSGKTSILRAIAGLLRLDHERVRIGAETWSDSRQGLHLPARLRQVGFVSQHYALFPHLTVRENVETALLAVPPGDRGERARACLALAQIERLDDRYPREISGGQRQRVALARAIAREPRVLLLDEPFSSVDRTTRGQLYVELLRLHERIAATIVVVTHDLDEAAQLASHLCLLHDGRLLQAGQAREELARPRSEEAARLLDMANVFDGHIELATGRRSVLRWGPHVLRAKHPAAGAVRWGIAPGNVLLVRPDKPWSEQLENPVPGIVMELILLGADALVWLAPEGLPDARVQMRLPLRALARHPLAPGQAVTVCLRGADLMIFADRDSSQGT
jgi:molybdate transport system ATP-binding protein